VQVLKIDDKAILPAPPAAPAPAETGEPTPEEIWREPASRLLARLETKIGGSFDRGGSVPSCELWRERRVGRHAPKRAGNGRSRQPAHDAAL
jgi:hypothetical protein